MGVCLSIPSVHEGRLTWRDPSFEGPIALCTGTTGAPPYMGRTDAMITTGGSVTMGACPPIPSVHKGRPTWWDPSFEGPIVLYTGTPGAPSYMEMMEAMIFDGR